MMFGSGKVDWTERMEDTDVPSGLVQLTIWPNPCFYASENSQLVENLVVGMSYEKRTAKEMQIQLTADSIKYTT